MIYCLVKKPEEYLDKTPSGTELGLWTEYGHNPLLFNIISRMTVAPFQYEPGFELLPPGLKICALDDIDLLKGTLKQEVGGLRITDLLRNTTPLKMFEVFEGLDLNDLEVCKLYGGGTETLLLAMRLRTLQYRKHYRGRVRGSNGVISVKFKSDLTNMEDTFLESSISTMFKSHMNYVEEQK